MTLKCSCTYINSSGVSAYVKELIASKQITKERAGNKVQEGSFRIKEAADTYSKPNSSENYLCPSDNTSRIDWLKLPKSLRTKATTVR